MTHYTGMGPGTINHYQHVVAQMHAHLPDSHGQNLHSAHGQVSQAHSTHAPAYASHHFHSHGSQPYGYNPMINNDMGAVGRAFMRNLFH
jgi:hypothetical protein